MEWVFGAVSRAECAAINKSYIAHIDRLYMRHIGGIARVAFMGYTLEVYGGKSENQEAKSALTRRVRMVALGAAFWPAYKALASVIALM